MKSLFIAIAVILALILAMGGLSSLSGSLSQVVSATTTAITTTSSSGEVNSDGGILVDDNFIIYNSFYSAGDSSVMNPVADYTNGECYDYFTGEESNRIFMGTSKQGDSAALIGFCFDQLEVGKKYLIHFYHTTDVIDSVFRYRYGNSSNLNMIEIQSSRDGYHTLVFEATGTSFQLFVVHFPEMPSSSTLQIYGDELVNDVMFTLYEVTE